ncbi:MAG TPA: family 10 glycosylhydrolase [Methylomirabilota bacterium]|nr:family 10 glycosylhydrolase [Methylomirabilota bacterium]
MIARRSVRSSAIVLIAAWAVLAPEPHSRTSAAGIGSFVPPEPRREFRAAWIATVSNIDWPSKPGLPVEQQKAELLALLNTATNLNLNAVILQVRPACDALYASPHEPWSEYLTGRMGQAPSPHYDPLAFAVTEAHRRGLELHAWFNPYRARIGNGLGPVASNHISRTHPHLVRRYGRYLWLDPGDKAVHDHSLKVILDVVKRYDIDGVHLDDYFYPYKEKDRAGKAMDFPDESTWQRYVRAGGKMARDDWRRANVNTFVRNLYAGVKAEKPWVKVGLSPFGIWRPIKFLNIDGLDAYHEIYADSRLWFVNGWLDYLAPQLYWGIDQSGQSFPVLLGWWADQNQRDRHLWPGMNDTRVGTQWPADEIARQILLTRRQPGATGHVHWNISALHKNTGGLRDLLRKGVYAEPALVPPSPWLSDERPPRPLINVQPADAGGTVRVHWKSGGNRPVARWVLQTRSGSRWLTRVLPANTGILNLAGDRKSDWPQTVAVTAIDRYGNASPAAIATPVRISGP